MKKYLFEKLKDEVHINRLEVQSFEMNVYLVKLEINGESGFVYDSADRPMRFHSSQHVRDAFGHFTVETAVMVHDSPYDEMIGNPNKPEKRMEMPFSMQQPY